MNIIITGATSGIGLALASMLGTAGSRLVLAGRRTNRLQNAVRTIHELGGQALGVTTDLESETSCIDLARQAEEYLGMVDVVIHNAGRGNCAAVQDTGTDIWRTMFALNVDAPFYLTRALLPAMIRSNNGHHIYVSSMAGKIGYPFNAAYVAAKHALVGFVAALRAELITTSINATVICPSGVSTEWSHVTEQRSIHDLYSRAIPASRTICKEMGLPLAPLKKMMSADEVAAIIVNVLRTGRSSDVYTHEGTAELAYLACSNRIALEDQHRGLWTAMNTVYYQQDPL
ncbi:MAG: SDR family NAD(P)-dependent oxidoreductase [Chlorobi bacterium]|nr:MAG: SDR family NAD(P)-dependent oxidoreductase [Bacteroidota bacterium]KXK35744.1 MAG: oxidoreductase [Chlorobi bacterium OLB6]MBE2265294.1 SDR family NAD(P)-dependent oxidoreductase [Flavobacteriales bacterium]MBL1160243.1 SDR family NAD(P)-dependent oxidoreductase [Chlorobiota bacterium]MBW7853381.1 SDR family NAD(P)-dependent oxidoreductase [Candidatus Kapabacteria bacterium]MCC6330428.1 SDR family NAD(P)-dependent oxidoreductase [Ignavibacteria bacterium]